MRMRKDLLAVLMRTATFGTPQLCPCCASPRIEFVSQSELGWNLWRDVYGCPECAALVVTEVTQPPDVMEERILSVRLGEGRWVCD